MTPRMFNETVPAITCHTYGNSEEFLLNMYLYHTTRGDFLYCTQNCTFTTCNIPNYLF